MIKTYQGYFNKEAKDMNEQEKDNLCIKLQNILDDVWADQYNQKIINRKIQRRGDDGEYKTIYIAESN